MKPSPDQMRLPFEKPSELAIKLRSIDWRVTGLTEHCWRQVREVLIAVAYCSSRGRCEARTENLLSLANDSRDNRCEELASLRTYERRQSDAVRLGLLTIERRYKKTSFRTVNHAKVEGLLSDSTAMQNREREAQTCAKQSGGSTGGKVADGWREGGGSTGGTITSLTNNNSTQLLETKTTGRQTTRKIASRPSKRARSQLGQVDEAAALQAARYWPEFGHKSSQRDWQLLVKCCWLSRNALSEYWLQNALEAVRHTTPRKGCNRWQLFWTVINEKESVGHLLARVEIPSRYQSPQTQEPRLCEVEYV